MKFASLALVFLLSSLSLGIALPQKQDGAQAHNERGMTLGKKGDLAGALVELRKAHELPPDNPQIRVVYEKLLEEMKH